MLFRSFYLLGFYCLVVIVMIWLLGLFCLFAFLLGYCGFASIFFFYACLYGILSFWVFWKSYVLVAKLWFCLIFAATDVCSWDFVVFEFNRDGEMWFLILFCSIMLFLNSNYPMICYSFTMFL